LTLLELGARAHAERVRRHGHRVYFCLAWASEANESAAAGGEAELRAIARARLEHPEVEHVAADVSRLTPYVAQVALRFGADELRGIPAGTPKQEIVRWITGAGLEPYECDANYQPFEAAQNPLAVLDS